MAAKTFVKKNTNENVKEELLNSLREAEINTANNSTEAIEVMNHYEEIIKTQHKRGIQYIYEQGEMVNMFKETERFYDIYLFKNIFI